MSTKARIRERLDTVRGATTAVRLVIETIRACLRYRVTGLASEAAFFMLLSLPPLVLGLFGGVGYIGRALGTDEVAEIVQAIRLYAATFLTQESITRVLLPTVADVFKQGRFELVSIGFVLALWSGSRALNVFIDTIAIMYGQSGVRGIVGTRVLSFSLYLGGLGFGAIIMPLLLIGPSLIEGWLPGNLRFLVQLYWPVVVLATVATLTTLFHIATPRRAAWWRDTPGAVLALIIWVLASFVVRGTVGASLGGTSIYGPLSAPIVVLIWLYSLAIAILIGAALNSATRVIWPVELRDSREARAAAWVRRRLRRGGSSAADPPSSPKKEPLSEPAAEQRALDAQYLDEAWEEEVPSASRADVPSGRATS